jgi:hypothetical protein
MNSAINMSRKGKNPPEDIMADSDCGVSDLTGENRLSLPRTALESTGVPRHRTDTDFFSGPWATVPSREVQAALELHVAEQNASDVEDASDDHASDDDEYDALSLAVWAALLPSDVPPNSRFLPVDALNSIITEKSVREHLLAGGFNPPDTRSITDMVCPPSEKSRPGMRRIFAILSLIERADLIRTFIKEDLNDDTLPLRLHRKTFKLYPNSMPDRELRAFSSWTHFLIESFDHYQWFLLAPTFSWPGDADIRLTILPDQTILPFTNVEESRDRGGYGSVARATIHPRHIQWPAVCLFFHALCTNTPNVINRLIHRSHTP